MKEKGHEYIAMISPDDFVRWVFPKLFYSRIPRYDELVKEHGYSITTDELADVQSEDDFIELVELAISRTAR